MAQAAKIVERRLGQATPFILVDRRRWPTPFLAGSGLYLHENQAVVVPEYQVNLPASPLKIGRQKLEPDALEMRARSVFPQLPSPQVFRRCWARREPPTSSSPPSLQELKHGAPGRLKEFALFRLQRPKAPTVDRAWSMDGQRLQVRLGRIALVRGKTKLRPDAIVGLH